VVEYPVKDGIINTSMSHEDYDYYQRRAEAEIALAQQASDQRVVQAHYDIAATYLDRIHGDTPKAPAGPLGG
ncbi:MAG: hypothetical protein JWO25_1197, partial [Alphaproteobacteria bacterium]|nr:hypothetical protein [Alphaproteobacteria bacterium]